MATSGVPVREQLFNGTVCRHSPFQVYPQVTMGGFGRQHDSGDFVEVLAPIIVPHPDGHHHRKGSHGDIIFLNSRGEVLSPLHSRFQIHFMCTIGGLHRGYMDLRTYLYIQCRQYQSYVNGDAAGLVGRALF